MPQLQELRQHSAVRGERHRILVADEIGTSLPLEEVVNLLPFMFLALNGLIPGPEVSVALHDVWFGSFMLLTTVLFFRTNARVHWELWTCRFGAAFLLYSLASVTWGTAAINATIRPSVCSICIFLYYNYLLSRFDRVKFTRMLVWAMGVMFTAGIALVLFLPGIGKDHSTKEANNVGSWQGVFAQKNALGVACAVAVAVAIGLKPKTHVDRAWRWYLLGVALLCSYKSQSRESWIAIFVIFLLFGFFKFIGLFTQESRLPVATISAVVIFGLAGLLYFNIDAALALIGRTRTLTGRTDIWDATMLLIGRRPWFGYGTYGVWGTPIMWDAQVRVGGWRVTSSHNDYLEVILSYGIIGFLIYIPIMLSSFLYMVRAILSYSLPELEVVIYCMIVIMVESFAAPIIMFTPALGMILILYCGSHLERVERSGFMRLPD